MEKFFELLTNILAAAIWFFIGIIGFVILYFVAKLIFILIVERMKAKKFRKETAKRKEFYNEAKAKMRGE